MTTIGKRRSAADLSPDGKPISIKYDGSHFIGRLVSNHLLKNVSCYHIAQSKINLDEVLFFGDSIGNEVLIYFLCYLCF